MDREIIFQQYGGHLFKRNDDNKKVISVSTLQKQEQPGNELALNDE